MTIPTNGTATPRGSESPAGSPVRHRPTLPSPAAAAARRFSPTMTKRMTLLEVLEEAIRIMKDDDDEDRLFFEEEGGDDDFKIGNKGRHL